MVYLIVKGIVGKNEGAVFICGDAKNMVKDVNKVFLSVLMCEGDYVVYEVEEILCCLKVEFRYY